jgi:hypothetical protein
VTSNACQEIQFFRCQGRITAAKLSLRAQRSLRLNIMTKVEYTGCPITMLILQNKPNLVRRGGFQVFVWQRLISNLQFCRKPKTNPNKPNSNPILLVPMPFIGKPSFTCPDAEAQRRRKEPNFQDIRFKQCGLLRNRQHQLKRILHHYPAGIPAILLPGRHTAAQNPSNTRHYRYWPVL